MTSCVKLPSNSGVKRWNKKSASCSLIPSKIGKAEKIAIAIAIAMLISGIETTIYYKRHNPDGSLKDNKPKKTYSVKHTAYDIKNESYNISHLQYDYENNEVTLGGEKIAKL